MRMSTKRAGFSKRRFRRKTNFPLVAVVQKRSKSNDKSTTGANSTQSVQKSRGTIDYKNVVLLRKLITAEGKILPRRINKLTAKQQRYTSKAIKSARIMGLLPFINKSRSLNIESKQIGARFR